jgi:hypothetical protein
MGGAVQQVAGVGQAAVLASLWLRPPLQRARTGT